MLPNLSLTQYHHTQKIKIKFKNIFKILAILSLLYQYHINCLMICKISLLSQPLEEKIKVERSTIIIKQQINEP